MIAYKYRGNVNRLIKKADLVISLVSSEGAGSRDYINIIYLIFAGFMHISLFLPSHSPMMWRKRLL